MMRGCCLVFCYLIPDKDNKKTGTRAELGPMFMYPLLFSKAAYVDCIPFMNFAMYK